MSELDRIRENLAKLHSKEDSRLASLLDWANRAEAFYMEIEDWVGPLCSEGKASIFYRPAQNLLMLEELPCRVFQLILSPVQVQISPPEFGKDPSQFSLKAQVFGPEMIPVFQTLFLGPDGRWRAGDRDAQPSNPPMDQESFFALVNDLISRGVAESQRLGST